METLTEYANRLGATLAPTVLEDMLVVRESKNNQPGNFFQGCDPVIAWLSVKDPSGGLNKSGTWPYVVVERKNGELSIYGCGH